MAATPNPKELFPANATINGIMVWPPAFPGRVAAFTERHARAPLIDRLFAFDRTADACLHLAAAGHMGVIVIAA